MQELKLQSSELAVLSLTWMLIHRIDESSPLSGVSAQMLNRVGWQVYAAIEARYEALGATVGTVRRFDATSIGFDQHYVEAVSRDKRGRLTVDLTRLGGSARV